MIYIKGVFALAFTILWLMVEYITRFLGFVVMLVLSFVTLPLRFFGWGHIPSSIFSRGITLFFGV